LSDDPAALVLYTVYGSPRDYPGEFVVRRSVVAGGAVKIDPELFARAPTLDAVRALLPPHLYPLPRQPGDDPVIVEVWL